MRIKCKYITMSGKCQKHSTPEVNEYCLGSPCEDYEGYGTKEVVPRYIDADALILALETQDYSGAPDTLEDWTPQDVTKAEIADINNAPTIDAVPVVRCKECKYVIPYESGGFNCLTCPNVDRDVDENWFCAYGEKMDEVEE